MRPTSNQPARIYATAKTHKFENVNDINIEELKFRPIIAQNGTYTYNASQVIGKYLKPLVSENPYIIKNTQDFAEILKHQPPLNENEEYVSYDVESLFTNIPIQETIEYIIRKIYDEKKIPQICSKTVFKRLLLKLTTESTFVFQNNYYKQSDGCTMGGPLSVILSDIYMTKLEEDVITPMDPPFYKRFVDDTFNKRTKNVPDEMFMKINNYHPNIKYTLEVKPERFLDTAMIDRGGIFETEVYSKPNKLPPHWSTKTPKRYKRNAINTELHRAKNISSNFEAEIVKIQTKYEKAGYPPKFINSVVKQFNRRDAEKAEQDELLIPENFFEEKKSFLLVKVPFCFQNEKVSKVFLSKLKELTNGDYDVRIKWETKKVKTLFKLKDSNPYPACVIYEGVCSCGDKYVGETKRNAETRWKEHQDVRKDSEPAKHLQNHDNHKFEWNILCRAPAHNKERKNLEACFIAIMSPNLNNQLESKSLLLFRNGVT